MAVRRRCARSTIIAIEQSAWSGHMIEVETAGVYVWRCIDDTQMRSGLGVRGESEVIAERVGKQVGIENYSGVVRSNKVTIWGCSWLGARKAAAGTREASS